MANSAIRPYGLFQAFQAACWVAAATALCAVPAPGAEQDAQSWNLVNYKYLYASEWIAELQVEVRINDDISRYSETLVKPGVLYSFRDWLSAGLGFEYKNRNEADNEYDIWQRVLVRQRLSKFDLSHQVRLDERFRGDFPGVLPQLRYVAGARHPLYRKVYVAASDQIRFNLEDKGTGPVGGFEQNRLYAGLGLRLKDALRLELGYMWRYERKRDGENRSDNIIRFQIFLERRSE